MFSDIHPVFVPRVCSAVLLLAVIAVIGLAIIIVSFVPQMKLSSTTRINHVVVNHEERREAKPLDRLLIFVIGGAFLAVGVFGGKSTMDLYTKATSVMKRCQPEDVLLTTRIERLNNHVKYYGRLMSPTTNGRTSEFAIYLGIHSSSSRYNIYQDAPAKVHRNARDSKSPMVIHVNDEYLVSLKGAG